MLQTLSVWKLENKNIVKMFIFYYFYAQTYKLSIINTSVKNSIDITWKRFFCLFVCKYIKKKFYQHCLDMYENIRKAMQPISFVIMRSTYKSSNTACLNCSAFIGTGFRCSLLWGCKLWTKYKNKNRHFRTDISRAKHLWFFFKKSGDMYISWNL